MCQYMYVMAKAAIRNMYILHIVLLFIQQVMFEQGFLVERLLRTFARFCVSRTKTKLQFESDHVISQCIMVEVT